MACNHIDEKALPSYESIVEPSDNIEVSTTKTKNCYNAKNNENRLTECQKCSCKNIRTSEQISLKNKDSNSEQCKGECSQDNILAKNWLPGNNQIDEIDITSIPREHNNWQLPKDLQNSSDDSLPRDVSTITVLPNELHIDMDADADLGSAGKILQPPPRYGSLIELILNDPPPNYSEATGVTINVDEVPTFIFS